MDRLRAIMDALMTSDSVSVAELAAQHGVSEMTIRRDLDELAQQGVARRIRGGAQSLLLRGEEPPFGVREHEATDDKRRIATEVAGLLADGEAIVLDGGTTTLAVARELHDRRLTVLPLALQSVQALSTAPRIRLVLPGGEVRHGELNITGPLTVNAIASLRFDTAVIGCCGLSAEHGMTAHNLEDVAVKQAAIASARRVVVAADSSKFRQTAFATVCPPAGIDVLVTDAGIPRDQHDALTAAGVTVRVAS
ncbi:DeoR/GlpR family DNA-binding transcription regulator [Sphaerisporangium corydalis]|uniref:Lactose phosphotransferase system repressor n=1 Tax=Sphaerisporangium corydalis TaxID=1441875 RepID=A0ABV9EPE1_9ACTN|nr:DeoR/GlpR family DNA-binding transcription regulator [Sphaerisporangium corydalis]